MENLIGKRVVVAGGTGKVGRYLVEAHLEAGATVYVSSRSEANLDALKGSLRPELRARLRGVIADLTDPEDAERVLRLARPLDGAVASLGRFQGAPSVLESPVERLDEVLDDYVRAHFRAAQSLIPAIRPGDGAYVMINGPMAFGPMGPGGGLVSVATAAQAMLARVLMEEAAARSVRLNEVVLYSGFGWGTEARNLISGEQIGRYVTYLLSERGRHVRGRSIHLRTPDALENERGAEVGR